MSSPIRLVRVIAVLSLAAALTVAVAQRSQTRPFQADGTEVEVRHYPPQGDGPHPLLLIVPPGLQTARDAGDVMQRYFRDTVADGWLIAVPIEPGTYFHRGAERLLAPLIDAIAEAYPVGDVHLVGVSTGAAGAVEAGVAAFEAEGVTVDLTVVEGSGHVLPIELGPTLTERLASTR